MSDVFGAGPPLGYLGSSKTEVRQMARVRLRRHRHAHRQTIAARVPRFGSLDDNECRFITVRTGRGHHSPGWQVADHPSLRGHQRRPQPRRAGCRSGTAERPALLGSTAVLTPSGAPARMAADPGGRGRRIPPKPPDAGPRCSSGPSTGSDWFFVRSRRSRSRRAAAQPDSRTLRTASPLNAEAGIASTRRG